MTTGHKDNRHRTGARVDQTATDAGRPAPRSARALLVLPWWDPDLAVRGHDPRGDYVEAHWLPVLGPSAMSALRWTSRTLSESPLGTEIALRDFARSLGLGSRIGRDSPASRCLDRLCYFGLARSETAAAHQRGIAVRTHVPSLPPHLHRRLPPGLWGTAEV